MSKRNNSNIILEKHPQQRRTQKIMEAEHQPGFNSKIHQGSCEKDPNQDSAIGKEYSNLDSDKNSSEVVAQFSEQEFSESKNNHQKSLTRLILEKDGRFSDEEIDLIESSH